MFQLFYGFNTTSLCWRIVWALTGYRCWSMLALICHVYTLVWCSLTPSRHYQQHGLVRWGWWDGQGPSQHWVCPAPRLSFLVTRQRPIHKRFLGWRWLAERHQCEFHRRYAEYTPAVQLRMSALHSVIPHIWKCHDLHRAIEYKVYNGILLARHSSKFT